MFAVLMVPLTRVAPIIIFLRLYHLQPIERAELQSRFEVFLKRLGEPVMGILYTTIFGNRWCLRLCLLCSLAGIADVAGMPIVMLAGGAVLLLLKPVSNMISRCHERKADQYAFSVTEEPEAFISGLRRLAKQSLAEERASRAVE